MPPGLDGCLKNTHPAAGPRAPTSGQRHAEEGRADNHDHASHSDCGTIHCHLIVQQTPQPAGSSGPLRTPREQRWQGIHIAKHLSQQSYACRSAEGPATQPASPLPHTDVTETPRLRMCTGRRACTSSARLPLWRKRAAQLGRPAQGDSGEQRSSPQTYYQGVPCFSDEAARPSPSPLAPAKPRRTPAQSQSGMLDWFSLLHSHSACPHQGQLRSSKHLPARRHSRGANRWKHRPASDSWRRAGVAQTRKFALPLSASTQPEL